MRIVRFFHGNWESYGVLSDAEIIDLPRLAKLRKHPIPQSIEGLISLGSAAETLLKGLTDGLSEAQRSGVSLSLEEASIKAPIASPPKIVCLGLNYRDHAEEAKAKVPEEPIIFMKPRTAIIGPGEPIVKPPFVKKLDYEAEIAVVIGKGGRDIPVSEAKNHIFGYMVFNDVSARDIQFKDGQWTRGKSFDTFAPIGPCITTADQIGDPNNLRLWTRVNGEVRQDSSTSRMAFNVYEIIYHLSRVMTLEPCDIIATGTPAGVAAFMKPEPKFLESGDTVEIGVEKIGTLRNRVRVME